MGLFGKFKESKGDAGALTGEVAPGPPRVSGEPTASLPPVDLNDPLWAPIDGITLDKYAQLTAAMARRRPGPTDQAQAWLETRGVQPGTWANVQTGWVNRMATNEAVRTRYGILYSQS